VLLSEQRLQRLRCPACGATTRAELPPEVPRGAFGPRLQAAVVTLAVRNRVSPRDAVELVAELFAARICAGSVEAILQRAALALDEPYEDLLCIVRAASALNIEKSGWRSAGKRRTLQGRAQRAGGALPQRRGSPPPRGPGAARRGVLRRRLRGPLVGLSTTSMRNDGSSALAHLVRDFTAHSEGLGAQKQFGAAGLRVAGRLFAAWGEFRGDADRNRRLERIGPLQEELRALLGEAARKSARNRRHRSFAGNLLKRWPALWSFAGVPGVEPTDNHVERGLRGAVIYRKLSHGSQSAQGERTIERLLSASVTCRLQGRSLFAYLSDVLATRIRGDPIPLLA
jgi:transposase